MLQIVKIVFRLLILLLVVNFVTLAPIKDQMGNVQIVYHVGDIVEHAYNADAWNTNIHPPNLLPNIPSLPRQSATGLIPKVNNATKPDHGSNHQIILGHTSHQNNGSIVLSNHEYQRHANNDTDTTSLQATANSSASASATKNANYPVPPQAPPLPPTTAAPQEEITTPPNLESTKRSLEAFLAMLEETRTSETLPQSNVNLSDTQQQPQQQQQQSASNYNPSTPNPSNLQLPLLQQHPQLSPEQSPALTHPQQQNLQPSNQPPQLPHPQQHQQSPEQSHRQSNQPPAAQSQTQPLPPPQSQTQPLPPPQSQTQPQPQQQDKPRIQPQQYSHHHPSQDQKQPSANKGQSQDWAVYDDLDTQESNQTAVIASNQKFGYIVHGNNYKRFRVEEKTANGYITGLFGVHHNNGGFRGVQYAADPASVNPKVLYDTLVKFLSL